MIWSAPVKLLSWAKKIPWQVYACTGALFFCWLYGNYRANLIQEEWKASVKRGKIIVAELKEGQGKITTKIEIRTIEKIKTIYQKGETIEKEIPVFIPSYNELLPGGFRLLHDAAATNTIPDSSLIPFAAPPAIGDVAGTVTSNYTKCHAIREVALQWQEWYQEQLQLSLSAQQKQQ